MRLLFALELDQASSVFLLSLFLKSATVRQKQNEEIGESVER